MTILRTSVYLDVCALCRPFDDQQFLRIRLETDAVNLIMTKVLAGQIVLKVSPVHIAEIKEISDVVERLQLLSIVENCGVLLEVDKGMVRGRATELVSLGFGPADAAHIAYAEAGKAKFITCDDRLVRKCAKHAITTWCGGPVDFCVEEDLR
jgi:predicted nucleic acid-binding protein